MHVRRTHQQIKTKTGTGTWEKKKNYKEEGKSRTEKQYSRVAKKSWQMFYQSIKHQRSHK